MACPRAVPLVLAVLVLQGCSAGEVPPVVAVAGGTGYTLGSRIGLEHGLAAHPGLRADTLYRAEHSSSAAAAMAVAEELVGHPGLVAVIGHPNSSGSLAAAPIYQAHGVLQLAPTASSPLYVDAGPLAFSLVPSDDQQGAFLARTLAEEVGPGGRIAILYVNDDYGRGLRDSALRTLDDLGLEAVLDLPHTEGVPPADEIDATVGLIESTEAEAIAFLGRGRVLGHLLLALRERVGPVPVVGPDGVGTTGRSAAPEGWGPEWQNVRYVDFAALPSGPAFDAFRTRFLDLSGGTEPTSTALLAFDAARVVVEGVASGARSGEALAAWLRGLDGTEPWMAALLGGPVVFDDRGSMHRQYLVVEPVP